MSIHTCTLCGYEYMPADGDPENGVPEGTDFEDISDTWICPVCGTPKDEFEPIDTIDD